MYIFKQNIFFRLSKLEIAKAIAASNDKTIQLKQFSMQEEG